MTERRNEFASEVDLQWRALEAQRRCGLIPLAAHQQKHLDGLTGLRAMRPDYPWDPRAPSCPECLARERCPLATARRTVH